MKSLLIFSILSIFFSSFSYSQEGVLLASPSDKDYKYRNLNREERKKLRAQEHKFRLATMDEEYFESTKPNFSKKNKISPKDNLKLLIWNIQKNVQKDWSKVLRKWERKADLVLLQEFNYTEEFIRHIQDSSPYYFATAYIFKEKDHKTGVANSTAYKAYNKKILYSNNTEPIVNMPKVTLFQWFEIEGRKEQLLVVNAHIINFVPMAYFIDQLLGIENQVRKHRGPIIFAGDFNTWSYEHTKYMNGMMKRLNLEAVIFKPDHRKRFNSYPLDHVFMKGLKVVSSETIKTETGSDHNAIYVEARFN